MDLDQRLFSWSSVWRARIKQRCNTSATFRDTFIQEVEEKAEALVLHLDDKLLPDLTGDGESEGGLFAHTCLQP